MTWLCTLCRREMSARWREMRAFADGPALAEDDPEIRAALESLLAGERRSAAGEHPRAGEGNDPHRARLSTGAVRRRPRVEIRPRAERRGHRVTARPFDQGDGVAAHARPRGISRGVRPAARRAVGRPVVTNNRLRSRSIETLVGWPASGMRRPATASSARARRLRRLASRDWHAPAECAAVVAPVRWWAAAAGYSRRVALVRGPAARLGRAVIVAVSRAGRRRELSRYAPTRWPACRLPVLSGPTIDNVVRAASRSLFGDSLSLRVDRARVCGSTRPIGSRSSPATLYVDSGGVNASPALSIATPAGDVRHIGTQFLVTVAGDAHASAGARRTRHARTRGRRAAEVSAGDGSRSTAPARSCRRDRFLMAPSGSGPPRSRRGLDVENRPLAEFLAWLAREHGWQLRYADAHAAIAHPVRAAAWFARGPRRERHDRARLADHGHSAARCATACCSVGAAT